MISTLVWKELKEIVKDRNMLSSAFSVVALLVLLNMLSLRSNIVLNTEFIVFYITPCLGVLVGFSLSSRFVSEKREGIVETLLCTPITLRRLWLGKVVGLTIPSYVTALLSTLILIIVKGCSVNSVIVAYLLVAVPVIIASTIGLLGFLYYALGMRQIQVLNYVIFFAFFATLYFTVKAISALGTFMIS